MKKVKKEYSYKEKSDPVVKIPKDIQALMIGAKKENFNIHILRIFGKILSRIKLNQIYTDNQYTLFSDDFFHDDNSLVRFNFKYRDFLPQGYTNVEPIKEALLSLKKYKDDVWNTVKNRKGEEINFVGGLIFNLYINKTKKHVTFDMNAYWYYKFLNIADEYNPGLLSLFYKTNSLNTIVFYNYITTLKPKGTTTKLETLNERFGTNYKTYSELSRSFLQRIKNELDKKGDWSFNYSKNDRNSKLIDIVPYQPNNEQEELSPKQASDSRIKRKVYYLQQKHDLSKMNVVVLKSVFKKYGYDIMNKVLTDNKKVLNGKLKGEEFISTYTNFYMAYLKNDKMYPKSQKQ